MFDSILILAVMVLFNVLHPTHVVALFQGGRYLEKEGLKLAEARVQELDGSRSKAGCNDVGYMIGGAGFKVRHD